MNRKDTINKIADEVMTRVNIKFDDLQEEHRVKHAKVINGIKVATQIDEITRSAPPNEHETTQTEGVFSKLINHHKPREVLADYGNRVDIPLLHLQLHNSPEDVADKLSNPNSFFRNAHDRKLTSILEEHDKQNNGDGMTR